VCILLHGGTLITLGAYGGIACMVVITLDRFWKIVHPIHHRKYYRPWMLTVGLILPWLNGLAVDLLPALGTSRIINGRCYPLMFWPIVFMRKVCSFNFIAIRLDTHLLSIYITVRKTKKKKKRCGVLIKPLSLRNAAKN